MTADTPPRARILIADDHALIRQGIRGVLAQEPGWEVCGEAATGREAVTKASALRPDVVILDMTMPELNGLDAAVLIKRQLPETEIAILSSHRSEELIRSAFEAGVKSFIAKAETEQFLVEAVRALVSHRPFVTPTVSQIFLSSLTAPVKREGAEGRTDGSLSAREREVLQLVAEGRTNKEMAAALGIRVRTVENHRAAALRKLNLDSVADAVRYAIRNKMIEP
jgi:two-component system response regulator NreC